MSAHQQGDGALTPANHFGGSFGPNEWLVDEMYQNYLADPNSVDSAWHEFFSDFTPKVSSTPLADAPRGGTPPTPVRAQNLSQQVPPVPAQPAITQPAAVNNNQEVPSQELFVPAPTSETFVKAPAPTQETVAPQVTTPPQTPADPVVKPIPTLSTPAASSAEPIRGPSEPSACQIP